MTDTDIWFMQHERWQFYQTPSGTRYARRGGRRTGCHADGAAVVAELRRLEQRCPACGAARAGRRLHAVGAAAAACAACGAAP